MRILPMIVAFLAVGPLGAAPAPAAVDLPLIDAVKLADPVRVERLLAAGADVDEPQGDGATALHWAAHRDSADVAALLIRAGADVDATDDHGVTPLALACLNASVAMVDLLLEAAEEHLSTVILGELIDGGELSLGVGSTDLLANGRVGPDQRVRYRVTLPANRVISVFLNGEDDSVDTVLGIYDSEGSRLLGENDDADEETRSSAWSDLEVGAQPGVFTFEARVKNTSEIESFTLKVVGVEPEDEPADAEDEAEDGDETEDDGVGSDND